MTVGADVKSCYFSIKNAEATLEQLALKTSNHENKQIYEGAQQILSEIKQDLHKQINFLANEEPQYEQA